MTTEKIDIRGMTPEEKLEAVAGRRIIHVTAGSHYIVEDKPEPTEEPTEEAMDAEVVTLEDDFKRSELDAIAEKLDLNPKDYRKKGDIAKAIREAAAKQSLDLSDLVE